MIALGRRAKPIRWMKETCDVMEAESYTQQEFRIEFLRQVSSMLPWPTADLATGQEALLMNLSSRKRLETLWWYIEDKSPLIELARLGGELALGEFMAAHPAADDQQKDLTAANPKWFRYGTIRHAKIPDDCPKELEDVESRERWTKWVQKLLQTVSYTHLRAHET